VAEITIPSRFNGPLDIGQGGYTAGLAAGFLAGAVEVSLRRLVPLATPLAVARDEAALSKAERLGGSRTMRPDEVPGRPRYGWPPPSRRHPGSPARSGRLAFPLPGMS